MYCVPLFYYLLEIRQLPALVIVFALRSEESEQDKPSLVRIRLHPVRLGAGFRGPGEDAFPTLIGIEGLAVSDAEFPQVVVDDLVLLADFLMFFIFPYGVYQIGEV